MGKGIRRRTARQRQGPRPGGEKPRLQMGPHPVSLLEIPPAL